MGPPRGRRIRPSAEGTTHAIPGSGQEEHQMADLSGKTIAFLVAPEGVEEIELTEPWQAVEEADGTPRLLSTKPGRVQAFNHLDKGDTFEVDDVVSDSDPASYDALVLPGGVANPDNLRMDKQV